MKALVTWLAKRFGVTQAYYECGYDHGWKAGRAHPEIADENRYVTAAPTYKQHDPRGQAM